MRKTLFRKSLSLIVTLTMIVTMFSGFSAVSYAEGESVKFSIEVTSETSGGTGSVKGEVYSDYSGRLVVTGNNVNTSNAKVKVTMTDVSSLGVSGTSSYTRDITFDVNRDVSMTYVTDLFDKLNNTSLTLTYGSKSVNYTVTGTEGDYTLTPADSAAASEVWHAMVNDNNFDYGTKDDRDSYIVIKRGSWLKAGSSCLEFDSNYQDDLVLDNFGNLGDMNQNIRNAVVLNETDEAVEGVSFYLETGTKLAMGGRYAKLKAPAEFSFEVDNYSVLEDSLHALRDQMGSGSTMDMMFGLYNLMDAAFTAIGGQAIEADGMIGDRRIQELQDQVDELKDQVEELQSLTKLFATKAELDEAVDTLNGLIGKIQDEIEALRDDLNNLDETFATDTDLDNAIANLEGKINSAKAELENGYKAYTDAAEQRLQEKIDALKIQIDNAATKDDINALADEIEDLNEAIEDAQEAIEALKESSATDADLDDAIANLEGKINSAKAELENGYKAYTDAAEQRLQEKIDALKIQIDNAATKDDINALADEIEDLNEAIEDAQEAIEALKENSATQEDLTEAVADLEKAIEDAKKELTAAAEKYTDAAKKELQGKIDALQGELDNLDDTYATDADVSKKIEDARKAIEDAQAAVDAAQDAALTGKVDEINKAIEAANTAVDEAGKATLDAAKAYTDTKAAALQSQIDALEGRIKTSEGDNSALKEQLKELKSQLTQTTLDGIDVSVIAKPVNYKKIKVSWSTSKRMIEDKPLTYSVFFKKAADTNWTKLCSLPCKGDGEMMSYALDNVDTGTTYEFYAVPSVELDGQVVEGSDSVSVTTKTKLAKGKITKTKRMKKKIKVSFRQVKGATGYQLMYRASGDSKYKKTTIKAKNKKTMTKTIKKLKSKKLYTLKVRAYRVVNGKKVYGAWSTVKRTRTK